ncbi:30S ribosomal protein S6 [uncultured Desulfobacterium sp.]|uniref:Small ribosomal subunit protein bS6 n=1 Tax=uncultured Desulfobacterium sp. TaxID=201089 RepID=A0A445N2N9_9BACT|nr:30S ribosomal protein S6 [uncultured Desulfobacterium sp.]
MNYYETLYLINPNLPDEEYRDIVAKFKDIVEKNNGVIINIEEWGKKTLAYVVKKFDKGFYVLLQYCGKGSIISEIERNMQLDERVLKFQTIKLADNADPEEIKAKAKEQKERATQKAETTEEERPDLTEQEEDQEEKDDDL